MIKIHKINALWKGV